MALFKCKMCGGDLEITEGTSVAECEYCGTQQTLPKVNDEVIQNLFNRANNLRLKCEFDKAEQVYEKILQKNEGEAEAHWGIVLCKYGIEYVEDPKTFKRIPTCHRTSYDAVTADGDYLSAIEHADTLQKSIYEAEAKAIDEIQKNILSIVKNEKPFDVFLCYKETDESGKRTVDSVVANDIYYQLTQEGLKVFYAAITLEDKLGQAYEPYIFAALNSAKVMLVIGTQPQYFTAVWVKNEWSRFLKLMKTDRSKLLIPCYKDMDAYDLPEEFSHLQAQDMSKIGFINDVVRGIKKVATVQAPKATAPKETVVTSGNTNTAPLLRRAFMFLEDGDWNSAEEYCEKVLDLDPENAQAYLGKLMAELKVKKQESLKDCAQPFDKSNNYQKVKRFAEDTLKATLEGYIEHINVRNENARLEDIYTRAKNTMSFARSESAYIEAGNLFRSIPDYRDSALLSKECTKQAEGARKDAILAAGKGKMVGEFVFRYNEAIEILQSIPGWKDADQQVEACLQKIQEIRAKEEAYRIEARKREEQLRAAKIKRAKQIKIIAIISAPVLCAIIAFIIVLNTVIIPNSKYNDAVSMMDAGKYTEAITAFEALGDYKDCQQKIAECQTAILDDKYNAAKSLMDAGKYIEAMVTFNALGSYRDAQALADSLREKVAVKATIDAGFNHTVGLKANGTVAAVGANGSNQCRVSGWKNIVAISAGGDHTVGLKADGTVVAVGYNEKGQCNVSGWKDIVSISAGGTHTVGLKADGTVVAVGSNLSGQCNVFHWKDIVAISAGSNHAVGLKVDGTVVAVGSNSSGQCNISHWKNIVSVSVGDYHTVGLKADGTVVAVGSDSYDQCKVSGWKDIVAISAGEDHTVGLKADGTVVVVGDNRKGQCNVSGWKNIKVPD